MTTLEQIRAELGKYDDTDLIKAKYVRQILDKYAEQEPCDDDYQTDMDEAWKQAKREPCDDVVSRQAVIQTLNKMDRYTATELTLCDTDKKFPANEVFIVDDVYEQIAEELPPVRPQEQTGHWTNKEFRKEEYVLMGKCSVCGRGRVIDGFCSYCGCRMVEPQESEDKE